jgi:hypothetical protein
MRIEGRLQLLGLVLPPPPIAPKDVHLPFEFVHIIRILG